MKVSVSLVLDVLLLDDHVNERLVHYFASLQQEPSQKSSKAHVDNYAYNKAQQNYVVILHDVCKGFR